MAICLEQDADDLHAIYQTEATATLSAVASLKFRIVMKLKFSSKEPLNRCLFIQSGFVYGPFDIIKKLWNDNELCQIKRKMKKKCKTKLLSHN